MKILMTQKQYDLAQKVLNIMVDFYGNNLHSLFAAIAEQYGVTERAVTGACELFCSTPVTAPAPDSAKKAQKVLEAVNAAVDIHIPGKTMLDPPFTKKVSLDEKLNRPLFVALDIYCRVLLGQFDRIYEYLDIDTDNQHILDAWHDARWYGIGGAAAARDLLIPGLKNSGWNGNYGITSHDTSFESKLAYEMCKVLKKDSNMLRVTQEPLMEVVG